MPIISDLLEGIPNIKLEFDLYKNNYLVLGWNLDYLIASKSLGGRLDGYVGLKTQLDRVSLILLYNWESMGFVSFYKDMEYMGLD
jgi:hypothetical protein